MFLDFMPASKRTSHLLKVGDGDRVFFLFFFHMVTLIGDVIFRLNLILEFMMTI